MTDSPAAGVTTSMVSVIVVPGGISGLHSSARARAGWRPARAAAASLRAQELLAAEERPDSAQNRDRDGQSQ